MLPSRSTTRPGLLGNTPVHRLLTSDPTGPTWAARTSDTVASSEVFAAVRCAWYRYRATATSVESASLTSRSRFSIVDVSCV